MRRMARRWEGRDLGASTTFLFSPSTRQTMRQRIQMRLFWRMKTESSETRPRRHSLLVRLQQNMAAMTERLAASVQSRKLKKQMVGVSARLRLRVRLPAQGQRKSQTLSTQTTKMLEKKRQLMARISPSSAGSTTENTRCRRYSPGGVVILGSHSANLLWWQARNWLQWKCSSMQGSETMRLKRQRRMRLGTLMKSSSLRMELRCSRMGVFFYLKPSSDSNTFILLYCQRLSAYAEHASQHRYQSHIISLSS